MAWPRPDDHGKSSILCFSESLAYGSRSRSRGFRRPETWPPGLASRTFSALPGNCPAGQGRGIALGVLRKEGQ